MVWPAQVIIDIAEHTGMHQELRASLHASIASRV